MLTLKILSALEKPFIDKEPQGWPEGLAMSALSNETLSFQVAYHLDETDPPRARRQMLTLQVDCAVPFRLRRVEQVAVRFPCPVEADEGYLSKEPGLYPDPLVEQPLHQRLPAYLNQWGSLWVDIEPDHHTQPGDFSFALRVLNEEGTQLASLVQPFRLIAAALPAQKLIHARWLHYDALSDVYGVLMFSDRHFEIIESYVRAAVRRGVNMMLLPAHTPPLDTRVGSYRPTTQLVDIKLQNGVYSFGFDRLRRFVALCKDAGVTHYEVAHLFTQWGAYHAPQIVVMVDGKPERLFGWDTDATGPEYSAFLKAYLPALIEELRRLGIADNTVFHISDEPRATQIEQYQAAKAVVEPLLKGFKIMDALSDFSFYESGAVAHPIPSLDHMDAFLAAEMPELWTYYCVSQHRAVSNAFIAMPSSRTRILGLQLYLYRIEGFLQWAYNFYYSQYADYPLSPWQSTDADGFAPAGDAMQVYPGLDQKPVESLRMMVFFHALQDLRALEKLEQKIGRDALLELVRGVNGSLPTLTSYPLEADYLLRLRQKVNEALENA